MGFGVRVLMQHLESPDQDPSPPVHPKSPVAVQGEPRPFLTLRRAGCAHAALSPLFLAPPDDPQPFPGF